MAAFFRYYIWQHSYMRYTRRRSLLRRDERRAVDYLYNNTWRRANQLVGVITTKAITAQSAAVIVHHTSVRFLYVAKSQIVPLRQLDTTIADAVAVPVIVIGNSQISLTIRKPRVYKKNHIKCAATKERTIYTLKMYRFELYF